VTIRKTTFLLGGGIGFILGSRMGRGPYQQLERKVRAIVRRPAVQDTVGQLKDAVQEQAAAVIDKVSPSGSQDAASRVSPPEPTPETYVDPQDLQFSTAAAHKEAIVDDLLEQGAPPAEIEQKEQELRRSGALHEPPAGNKAQPAKDR
jgi:hypothetical protein